MASPIMVAILNTFSAISTFCGAHPLGAPRLPADCSRLPNKEHSAFGPCSVGMPPPIPIRDKMLNIGAPRKTLEQATQHGAQ